MRAAQVVRHGAPGEAVEVVDVAAPEVAPGLVRIAVSAASLNFGDIARCRGGVASVMAQPPFTLGMDVCGTVESAGEGSEHLVGQRVVAITQMAMGGIAELALAPAHATFAAPPELDDAEAAAFTLPFHVAHLALSRRARLQDGESLLVVGGASSVGTAAIQLGVAAGARVLATAGGPEKGKLVTELGATAVDHTTDDLFDAVQAHTGGTGADVAFDVVGGDGTEAVWTCMALGGRYLAVGFNDDQQSGMTGRPLRKVSMGNFSVLGVLLSYNEPDPGLRRFGLHPFPPAVGAEVHAELLSLVADGRIRPVVGRRIGIDEVGAALDDHDARRTAGRTVVVL